jgi:hypothetical protein
MIVVIFMAVVCVAGRTTAYSDVRQPKNDHETPQDSADIPKPDLAVLLSMKKGKINDPTRGICDVVKVDYVITNEGLTPVGGFKVTIEKKDVKRGWREYIVFSVPELGIGKSTDGQCGRLRWCPGDRSNVGFRLTADSERAITEFDETNNRAEAVHPSERMMQELSKKKK